MATKTVTELVDDIDGKPADETVSFGLDGVQYEIDLATDNAEALREALAPWAEAARRTGGRRGPGRPVKVSTDVDTKAFAEKAKVAYAKVPGLTPGMYDKVRAAMAR